MGDAFRNTLGLDAKEFSLCVQVIYPLCRALHIIEILKFQGFADVHMSIYSIEIERPPRMYICSVAACGMIACQAR